MITTTMENKDMSNTISTSIPTLASTHSQPSPLVLVEETASTKDSTPFENLEEGVSKRRNSAGIESL